MHNGRTDLLFPTHPPQHVSAIILRGWGAAPRTALVIFRLAKERQFGFIIIRARPSVRLVPIDGGFKSGRMLKATFQVC